MSGVETREVSANEADMRLDRWFKLHYPQLPFGRLQKILRKGEVRVDGKRAKTNQRLEAGQSVRIPPLGQLQEAPADAPKTDRRSDRQKKQDEEFVRRLVIYKDRDVLAINKPSGLAVQGGTKTERHLDGLLDHLQLDGPERPRLVHRLDRDTSGVMLLARHRQAATELGRAFKGKDTRKVYWALTAGVPDPAEGTIDLPLSKGGGKGAERVFADPEEGKQALTVFKVLENAGRKVALVALWPRTGRTHQLRAHLAAIGTPIVGDGKYGGKDAFLGTENIARKLHLHAREIDVPGGGPRLRAPFPDHMNKAFDLFEFNIKDYLEVDPFEEF